MMWLISLLFLTSGCNTTPYNPIPDFENLSAGELDLLIETGLKAWRTKGLLDGGATCAHCHAPDGFDLAYIDFTDFHIRRRGAMHVGKEIGELNASQLEDIINMTHAIRVKYGITPRNSSDFYPFQHESRITDIPLTEQRELAFVSEMQKKGFRFTEKPVLDIEEAMLQKSELSETDLWSIPFGIELMRWSEDPYYGKGSQGLLDWLPILPVIPAEYSPAIFFALHDEYLQWPTDKNLEKLLEYISEVTAGLEPDDGNQFMYQKYRAMLIAQHWYRKSILNHSAPSLKFWPKKIVQSNESGFSDDDHRNPFWAMGEIASKGELYLPESALVRYTRFHSLSEQIDQMSLPWLWLGWLLDPGFENTPCELECAKLLSADLLKTSKKGGPYFIHQAFFVIKLIERFGLKSIDIAGILPVDFSPDPYYRQVYIKWIENGLRMGLFIELDEGAVRHQSMDNLADYTKYLEAVEQFFLKAGSEYLDENLQLIEDIREKISKN